MLTLIYADIKASMYVDGCTLYSVSVRSIGCDFRNGLLYEEMDCYPKKWTSVRRNVTHLIVMSHMSEISEYQYYTWFKRPHLWLKNDTYSLALSIFLTKLQTFMCSHFGDCYFKKNASKVYLFVWMV